MGVKTICYLRVYTADQDTNKFRTDVRAFAMERGFSPVEFIEETISTKEIWKDRKIGGIVDELAAEDRLIVPELLMLGRTTIEILDIMQCVRERDAFLYAVKGGWDIDDSIPVSAISVSRQMLLEIGWDLRSRRTREGLAAKRSAGAKLGRPPGPGKSKLDTYAQEIKLLLSNGSTKTFIANKYGTTAQNLNNWLRKKRFW